MTTPTGSVIVDRRGSALWITLNRPDRLNALNGAMATELADLLGSVREDDGVRVVVIRGAGKGFCAGLDLKAEEATTDPGVRRIPDVVIGIHRLPQPVIALVHGAACGGGFAMALAADIRIAGESARMNDAFITLGLSGCELGMSYHLPRQLGQSVAAELMFTGRFIDAQRALRLGLVSDVVHDDELEATAETLVAEMLRATPAGLRRTKETMRKVQATDDLEAVIAIEGEVQAELARDPEFLERIRMFSVKRG